jgi:hypothetical protein
MFLRTVVSEVWRVLKVSREEWVELKGLEGKDDG